MAEAAIGGMLDCVRVVRLRFPEPLPGVDHLRVVQVALPLLLNQSGFAKWFVVGEPELANEVPITTLWDAEEPSITTVLREIATRLGAEIVTVGAVAVVADDLRSPALSEYPDRCSISRYPDTADAPDSLEAGASFFDGRMEQ
jgi:hypothetical protein